MHYYIIVVSLFFFTDTATTEIYTLSLTTLFRSSRHRSPSDASATACGTSATPSTWDAPARRACGFRSPAASSHPASPRSEEHTSELQSQSNLVCRLLLEKKKKNIYFDNFF